MIFRFSFGWDIKVNVPDMTAEQIRALRFDNECAYWEVMYHVQEDVVRQMTEIIREVTCEIAWEQIIDDDGDNIDTETIRQAAMVKEVQAVAARPVVKAVFH